MAKFIKQIYKARPWYHDFEILGIQTNFEGHKETLWVHLLNSLRYILKKELIGMNLRGIKYVISQQIKMKYILPFMKEAISNTKKARGYVNVLDLFCSDGYYSFIATNILGADKAVGIDINKKDIKRCDIMKKYFPEQNVEFKTANVFNIDINDDINVCLCFGGLYHISNPQDLLCKLYNSKILYLVVQSVTSIKFEDENYFVTPAPCCNRGCRFSHKKLLSMIKEAGWEIVREGRNEIIYNKPVSRGSSYVLCRR